MATDRKSAVSLIFELDEGDGFRQAFSRKSGLYAVSKKRIMRVRGPEHLDPDEKHENVPWEKSLYLPHGSSDPLVARTILQTSKLASIFFANNSAEYEAMMEVSWEVMNSLISLRFIRERLERGVTKIIPDVEKDLGAYTTGQSPKPLPIVEYYDIEFRSFANEVRRTLSKISELFGILAGKAFDQGRFDKALEWAKQTRGEDSLLASMLKGDLRWIETWIAIRVAIEHPKANKYIETLNFNLEPDRKIRLPTWRFVHPDYDMARPQNLLDSFSTCIDNLLKFFEDVQVVLIDGHLPKWIKVSFAIIEEKDRDPDEPMRYQFQASINSPDRTAIATVSE